MRRNMIRNLFGVICQIIFAIAMFITTIFTIYQKMYWACVITAILTILCTRNIPNRIEEYKKSL